MKTTVLPYGAHAGRPALQVPVGLQDRSLATVAHEAREAARPGHVGVWLDVAARPAGVEQAAFRAALEREVQALAVTDPCDGRLGPWVLITPDRASDLPSLGMWVALDVSDLAAPQPLATLAAKLANYAYSNPAPSELIVFAARPIPVAVLDDLTQWLQPAQGGWIYATDDVYDFAVQSASLASGMWGVRRGGR